MSRGYGIDLYGVDTYGFSGIVSYSVAPFTADQTDYGKISLYWSSPNSASWKYLALVKSPSGYPSKPADGTTILTLTPQTMITSYDDIVTQPGVFYYYAFFITLEAPTYNPATTYILNQQVLYNGQYWSSNQNGNTGNTPSVGSSFWQNTSYLPTWLPAGYASSVSLEDQGYGTRLYKNTPQPYKINTSSTFSDTEVDNPALQEYLNVLGFGLSQLKGEYDGLLHVNDPAQVPSSSLDILSQQFGIKTDYLSSPEQRRQRLANASINYRIKGTNQSIHNVIAEITDWDSKITYGPNIMNSPDQTSFPHPSYDSWNANTLYKSGQLVQYNGYNYSCATAQAYGQSQAPTGAKTNNTWWNIQYQIINTAVNLNPRTLGQSTWSLSTVGGQTASVTGIMTGIAHPTNTAVNNYNALSVVATSVPNASFNIFSIAAPAVIAWNNGTNYVVNNYVSYSDGYTYRAVKPSGPGTSYGAVIPNQNNQFWEAVYYISGDVPAKIRDTAPLPVLPSWSPYNSYTSGNIVSYNGNVFECVKSNTNQSPPLQYYSNAYWAFIRTGQQIYDLSLYGTQVNFIVVENGVTVITVPRLYSANGTLLNNTGTNLSGYSVGQFALTTRFINDYPDLNGTTEESTANASSLLSFFLGSPYWTSNPSSAGLWSSSFGQATPNQTVAGTNTYSFLLLEQTLFQGGRYCVTFNSDFVQNTTRTHGIVFAYADSNDFYYATRTSLRRVSGGTDTLLGSWTRLANGDRMVVDATVGGNLCVYKYTRNGDGSLQILYNAAYTGPSSISSAMTGLIYKYSPSGAL